MYTNVHEQHARSLTQKKSTANAVLLFLPFEFGKLSLGELRCFTCLMQSVFLTFFRTRVTSEVTFFLEDRSVCFAVCDAECSCDAVTDSACLAGVTAAVHVDVDVKLVGRARCNERLIDDEFHRVKREILVESAFVDDDRAVAGDKTNSCDSGLSSAGAEILNFLGFLISHISPLNQLSLSSTGHCA